MSAADRRASEVLAVAELLARYTRAVDDRAFDRLVDVFDESATVRYRWLPVGADEHDGVDLAGRDAVIAWLRSRLAGRPGLRRYVSNLEVLDRSPAGVTATMAMHERDMRITGTYRVEAGPGAGGWVIRRLDLVETIHHH